MTVWLAEAVGGMHCVEESPWQCIVSVLGQTECLLVPKRIPAVILLLQAMAQRE